MLSIPFQIEKDLSKNKAIRINLTSEKLKNKSTDIANLKVILLLSYHSESFELSLNASTRINEKTKIIEFNMGDILETIFSNLIKDFKNDYYLSYYMNNSEETKTEKNDIYNIKTFKYLGEINSEFFEQNKNLYFKLPKDNTIYLKLREKIQREKIFDPDAFEENENDFSSKLFKSINLDEEEEEKKIEKGSESKSRRDKEKTIGYAILKVYKWEKIREKGCNNITLDDAAKTIGMAKKTLDDYKNQIKKGKEQKFNFNKYYKCKINVLKNYNSKGKIKNE